MKPSTNRQKILMYFLGIVVVISAVYYYMKYSSTISVSEIVGDGTETVVVGEDILVLVQKLESVSIDESIFSDAVFTTLRDYSVPVGDESQSRPNPFAPIGFDVGVVR